MAGGNAPRRRAVEKKGGCRRLSRSGVDGGRTMVGARGRAGGRRTIGLVAVARELGQRLYRARRPLWFGGNGSHGWPGTPLRRPPKQHGDHYPLMAHSGVGTPESSAPAASLGAARERIGLSRGLPWPREYALKHNHRRPRPALSAVRSFYPPATLCTPPLRVSLFPLAWYFWWPPCGVAEKPHDLPPFSSRGRGNDLCTSADPPARGAHRGVRSAAAGTEGSLRGWRAVRARSETWAIEEK